jgi:hypothetical protein
MNDDWDKKIIISELAEQVPDSIFDMPCIQDAFAMLEKENNDPLVVEMFLETIESLKKERNKKAEEQMKNMKKFFEVHQW